MEKVWSLFSSATKQNSYSSSYSIESASEQSLDPLFTLKKGKRNSDNLQVSVFEYKLSKDKSEENLRLAKLFLRRLKTLRHPNLLKFYDGEETDTLIAVCTEPVEPLHIFLESEAENLTSKQQEYQILWGLHQLLKAVHFLNSSSLAHCNVGLHSVYVDDAGDWKLGGLQYSRPLEELDDLNCLPNSHYLPPEIRKKKSFSSENPLWSVDVYSIGILIWEVS
jgi:SCY1-like protein 1